MTPTLDLFVGIVAIVFGGLLLLGAVFDGATLMSLRKSQLLSEAVGKAPARAIVGAIGVAVVTMGILIASGWRVHW
jgi:hypothetical protein